MTQYLMFPVTSAISLPQHVTRHLQNVGPPSATLAPGAGNLIYWLTDDSLDPSGQ